MWRSTISVRVASPGPTDTELFSHGKSEEQKQRFAQMAAQGRLTKRSRPSIPTTFSQVSRSTGSRSGT